MTAAPPKLGAIFQAKEMGADPAVIRDFAQTAEGLGYDYVSVIDHVILGSESATEMPARAEYTRHVVVHEPLTLIAFMAGLTSRLGFSTAILILPQRQTVLFAKQAAELDALSGGRLRLGVGLGWNPLEYEALGKSFADRGRHMEEQTEVLRALWTRDLVTFDGRDHTIRALGLNPMPVQRPIPLWYGAFAPRALRRAGRLADGLILNPRMTPDEAGPTIETFRRAGHGAGRAAADMGIEASVSLTGRDPEICVAEMEAWRPLGATHVTARTRGCGPPSRHLEALRRLAEALGR